MDDKLSPATREEIQALCRKISVAHHLDAEIQEELHGHMEDKLAAYLDGEEALSEQDAFILVREHFGDPAALKRLLQDVHVHETHVSLALRLAVAFAVTTGLHALFGIAARAFLHVWPAARGMGGFQAVVALAATTAIVVSWLLLWRWQRGLAAGRTPWLLTRRPVYLVGVAALVWLLQSLAPISVLFDGSAPMLDLGNAWLIIVAAITAWPVLQCIVWLWWCDRPPRRARTAGAVAGVWALWMWLSSSLGILGGCLRAGALPAAASLPMLAQSVAMMLGYFALCAAIACGLYAAASYAATGLARASIARR
ncbi:MAG: hypothetical protein JXR94_22045 [Candidatus Hydrogenedentes bacterium]|nr:hypothetical protein [Candidatus Hydrogenedentota bacterium]